MANTFFSFLSRFNSLLWVLPGGLLFLSSCSLFSPNMTAKAYERIPIGSSVAEVEAQVGLPYRMTSPQAGVQQYYYLERIETGPGSLSQNTYVLTIVDGEVVNKQRLNEFNSLNLQIH